MKEKKINADEVDQLAKLPSKEILYAMLLGTLQAPMSQLVGVMNNKLSSLVYVLEAVRNKKEKLNLICHKGNLMEVNMSEEVKEATEVAVEEAKTEEVVEAPVSTEQTENSIALDGKMAEFVDWIETISVLELSQLVKALEDRLGVTACCTCSSCYGCTCSRWRL